MARRQHAPCRRASCCRDDLETSGGGGYADSGSLRHSSCGRLRPAWNMAGPSFSDTLPGTRRTSKGAAMPSEFPDKAPSVRPPIAFQQGCLRTTLPLRDPHEKPPIPADPLPRRKRQYLASASGPAAGRVRRRHTGTISAGSPSAARWRYPGPHGRGAAPVAVPGSAAARRIRGGCRRCGSLSR